MSDIYIDKNLKKSLYIQLYENIKSLIEENRFRDDKLPSIRSLAKKLNVNNVTVINAYKLLEQEGYVYSVKGSGTYIKRTPLIDDLPYLEEGDMELMVSGILPISKDSINLASVSPNPDLFPIEDFKQALVEVLDRDGGKAFLYPEITGYDPLRESISGFLAEHSAIIVNKEEILITSGGQQGLDIISKTLINQGDTIIVENPTYSGAMSVFRSRGARIIGIPMKEDGIDVSLLESYVSAHSPKFIYIMTNFQSPTTYSYSEENKIKILELANKYDFYIIEDDFLTDLTFSNNKKTPLKSIDKSNKVIFIKSFSKIFMPGVRIGFITLPNKLFKNIVKAKHTTDISSSGFLQRAFDLYLREGYWKNHIMNIKKVYEEKYLLIIRELERLRRFNIDYLPPNGGLCLWLKLPEDIDGFQLYKEAGENNLSLVPGKVFYINDTIYSNYIRLSFGSASTSEIIEAISILENLLSRPLKPVDSTFMPFI